MLAKLPLHILRHVFDRFLDFINHLAEKYLEFEYGIESITAKLSTVCPSLASAFKNHVSLVTTTRFNLLCNGHTAPLIVRLRPKMRDYQLHHLFYSYVVTVDKSCVGELEQPTSMTIQLATNGTVHTCSGYLFGDNFNGLEPHNDNELPVEQTKAHVAVKDAVAHQLDSKTGSMRPMGLRQIAYALLPDDVKCMWSSPSDLSIFPALEDEDDDES
ncbi:hypothetical protein MBLNU230_g5545t1 [Neophaeotheca triangularis]